GIVAHGTAELKAVHVRHQEVGDDDIGMLGLQRAQAFAAVGGDEHRRLERRELRIAHEQRLENTSDVPVVLDDEDLQAHQTSSAKWQAEKWPAEISRSDGISPAQRERRRSSFAIGQRGWKGQPTGGAIGEGGSPSNTIRLRRFSGSICGIAASSALV